MQTHSGAAAAEPLRVGVLFPSKKVERLRAVLEQRADDVHFVLLDLQTPELQNAKDAATAATLLAVQAGPLDALLHKLAHDMVFAGLGDTEALARVQLMQEFVRQNPRMQVVDPIESVRLLTDRNAACEMLLQVQTASAVDTGTPLFRIPKFHLVDSLESFQTLVAEVEAGDTRLPLICKSVEACATDRSHMMSVVTKREDLHHVEYPTLYQEFINHSSRLFKGYVLGDLVNVAERRSLPNLVAGAAQRVHFNTQEQYPTTKDFHPHDQSDGEEATGCHVRSQEEIFAAVRVIGERLREQMQLSLFGFDVIMADDGAQELYVIDVNYFPSYKEVEDLGHALRQHLKRQCGRA